MNILKEKILSDGKVIDGRILKVDSFLNHQIDVDLFNKIGQEFKELFKDKIVDKILTIEASGIGLACITAQYFNVPVVFAKKSLSLNLSGELYVTDVHSFTKDTNYKVYVSKSYIKEDENILIIDDFLAHGEASLGLMDIIEKGKAKVSGIGIVIEKGFQGGRKKLEEKGANVKSLAIIESMNNGDIKFK